jgi:two-component system, cell cycle sensor histidine kinase and response regulator CckA
VEKEIDMKKKRVGLAEGFHMNGRNVSEKENSENATALLASIVESSNDAIFSFSLDGAILSWNSGAHRIYGFTPEEVNGRNLTLIFSPNRWKKFSQLLETIKEGKAEANFITTHKTKRGGEVLLSLRVFPIKKDRSGRVTRAAVIAQDVTENEKAKVVKEMLLAERDELLERHQLQMESMPIACILRNQQFHFTYWNPAAERTFGYSFQEIQGKHAKDNILPPSEISAMENRIERLIKGELNGLEATLAKNIRKDGRIIICEWYNTPLRGSEGNFLGLMSMAIDVTERQKSEEVRSQLGAILQQTTDAVIGSDLEGRIFSWNRGAESMLGYPLEEILEKSTALLVPLDRKDEMEKLRELATKDENLSNYETVMLKRNGNLVEVSVTVSPIKDFEGKIVGVSAISRDITERKKAEVASKKHEEQMRLSEKMNAIGRLAGGVAHDFNNLLSVIGGNSDFLRDALSPGDPHLEEVDEIKKAVQRGAELTRQLLAIGKKQVVQPQLINLNELSTDMTKMFKRLIDASIDFALIQDDDLKLVQADPGQIQQVIMNLVLNARDAMPKGGNLIVVTKNFESVLGVELKGLKIPPGSYVGFSVTDTGTGMDEDTQKHVFEPFFTTKGEKGTGLGLATVYGIVNQWEGHLGLNSSPGVGTTFSVYFPVAKETAPGVALPKGLLLAVKGSETILVAEDEESVRKIVVHAMENFGYHVLQAGNGVEAIKLAWQYQDTIHLLLTDTIMPKMNGKELSDQLKKARPEMRILFMSGYPREVLSQQGKIDPSIHLIQKPFSNDELAERVRKVLDQK